ncbi:Uncharacterized protein GBIM_02882, partial [Gryllus bimaculatus]
MAALKGALLLAVLACLGSAKPPPGYIKKPEADEHPPKYEFGYDVRDGKGNRQGHLETREGELARGMYYVNLPGGAEQQVHYLADDWGYHPLVQYSTSGPHGVSASQFALGEKAVAALRGATSKGLITPIDVMGKSLKSSDAAANAVVTVFGNKGSGSAPQALALVAEAGDASQAQAQAQVQAQVQAQAQEQAQAQAQAHAQAQAQAQAAEQAAEAIAGGYQQAASKTFQTTVVQPVSNLLVQLPQVTYQTSFDASGSAITYTQGPQPQTSTSPAHIHSSQSGHYHFVSTNGGVPVAQQVLVVKEQDLNAASENAYAQNDVIETSTAAPVAPAAPLPQVVPVVPVVPVAQTAPAAPPSAIGQNVQVSYSESSSSSSSYNQVSGYVSSTPAPAIVQEQNYNGDAPVALNLIAQPPVVQNNYEEAESNHAEAQTNYDESQTNYAEAQNNYAEAQNNYAQAQKNYAEAQNNYAEAQRNYAEAQNNYGNTEKNGVLHLKYASKNNNNQGVVLTESGHASPSTATHTIKQAVTVRVNPTVSTPIVTQQVSYVTATGGGSDAYGNTAPSGAGYTVSAKDNSQTSNQVQEDHFVQISSYGGETNAAAEFGAKLKPSFRVKVTSTASPVAVASSVQKEYVRYNEVQNVEKYESRVVTQTPLPRSSFRPIVVAELETSEEVSVVTPSPSVSSDASNPAVVYSGASYSQTSNAAVSVSKTHVDGGSESSYVTTVRPVVVTPEPAYATTPAVTSTPFEYTTQTPEVEKEVLITPRPDPLPAASALVLSGDSGNKISATLPRVNSPNSRRQFKNKGLRTNKVSLTPAPPTALPPTASGAHAVENPVGERTRTIVEIQKAIPYELPVENGFSQAQVSKQTPVFVPAQVPAEPVQASDSGAGSQLFITESQQPSQDAAQQASGNQQRGPSQLGGSQLLLATLLEDHRSSGQAPTFVKPQLVQFRPQSDTLNPEFLNQIQIANAQSLLQAIQYETLRSNVNTKPKEHPAASTPQQETNSPIALPLVSQAPSEQQTLTYVNHKPAQASSTTKQTYETELTENDDDSTIFEIAKKIKAEQQASTVQAQAPILDSKKSKIQSLLELETQREPRKKVPQFQIALAEADKDAFSKDQIESIQRDLQSNYQKYLAQINQQVAQSQQYFNYLAQQPFNINFNAASQQPQVLGLQEPIFQAEQHQPQAQPQAQVQSQSQAHAQVHVQADIPQQQPQEQLHRIPQSFLQQLLEAESQSVGHAAVQQLNAESSKEEAPQDEMKAAGSLLGVPKVVALEKPSAAAAAPDKGQYAALEQPVRVQVPVPVAVPVPVERTKYVEVEKPVEAHGQAQLPPPPPPPALAYNFPHKDNLHRALLKQHGDSAPYGIGRSPIYRITQSYILKEEIFVSTQICCFNPTFKKNEQLKPPKKL